jgi:diaminohydroxyphosphoribosylaminopyrimidine deaminase/5-amino-6-(5-phosphoribosylamino)uracil reductase
MTSPANVTAAGADDARFMALALALGRRGLGRTWPNPAVGAVVVREEPEGPVVVGRGWTMPGGRPHAETEALARAGEAARGATLYVSLEPCSHHGKTPPCTDAIVAAGISRVVSALEDPNPKVAGQGHATLRAAGVTLSVGIGAEEARRAHAGHICRMREGRPHVTLKLAVSADGKAGLAGRRPATITGEPARARVHRLRAMHDAVLTGIGTVLADDPQLTCRLPGMRGHSPVRVVLDRRLRLPANSKLVATAVEAPVWVISSDTSDENRKTKQDKGITILSSVSHEGGFDLLPALRLLAGRGITRVMIEAGPRLSAAFLDAGLVDEAMLFRSPAMLGADALDALEGLPLSALTESPRLTLRATERLGDDTLEIYERA